MIDIVFKDLEKSELAKDATYNRMQDAMERFPDLERSRITITLSMENSPTQAGPDLFKVKFQCKSGKYNGVILERSAPTLYKALADVSESLLERLNRFGDKERVKKIKHARKIRQTSLPIESVDLNYGS